MSDTATGGQRADGAPIALRVLAYIADLCLASTVIAVALIINVLAGLEKGLYFLGGGVIVAIIASIVLHGAYAASPGKMLAGLKVVDADTRAALGYPASAIRSLVFNVLAPLVYLPAWSILADAGRRGIHEKASKTTVVDGSEVEVEQAPRTAAAPSGPLGGLVTGEGAQDDSGLQRIPTPLPGDGARTAALTDTGAETEAEPRERLQPPSLPPLPDDVPGLRPVPPRFGPPLAEGEQPAGPAAPAAAFASPPQAPVPPAPRPAHPQSLPPQPTQPPQPQSAPPRPASSAPPVPPQGPPPQRPSAPSPLQTAGAGGQRPAGAAPIVLRFDDGHSVDVRGDGIIGREPVIPAGLDPSKVTKHVLVDDTASVSKTHLLFGLTRGELWVEDVGSTNGSAIAYEDSWTELTKGVRYAVEKGSVVHMGQRSFKVLGG